MKKILLLTILVIPNISLAEGPRFRHLDKTANLEFQNVYQDLRNLPRVSSTTLPSGSTQYIQNSSVLQSGSTAFPEFLIVGSSATLSTVNVTGLLNFDGVTGSSGTLLVSQGLGATPIWSRGGRILQVVSSTMTSSTNNQRTSTSVSYSSTTLFVNITPVSNQSMVLVFVSQSFGVSGTAGTVCTARITRDSTDISTLADQHIMVNDSTTEMDTTVSLLATDLPGDMVLHRYQTRFARSAGSGTCIVNTTIGSVGGNGGYMLLVEVSR